MRVFHLPPRDVRAMLEADAQAEKDDVRNYVRLAQLAEEEGLFALKMQMEEQAADEDSHGQEMSRLLGWQPTHDMELIP